MLKTGTRTVIANLLALAALGCASATSTGHGSDGASPPNCEYEENAETPPDNSGWTYRGSLTTPPCTEGVAWHIYARPVAASAAQIATFHHEHSVRPLQPLKGRTVSGGD
jgi:carbonic anhydrase